MVNELTTFLEMIIIYIGAFLVERYVLLEKALPAARQQQFYFISALCTFVTYFLFGSEIASYVTVFFAGMKMAITRKKYKLLGFAQIIPIIGIINGIMVPILIIPLNLLKSYNSEEWYYKYTVVIYIVVVIALVTFYFGGKEWREEFSKNDKRSLQKWERALISTVGILMMILSNVCGNVMEGRDSTIVIIYGITSFVLTITVMLLVVQGNKRDMYHSQVTEMQISLINVLADVVESRDESTGGHIKRTSDYVAIIVNRLKKNKKYADILTKQYINNMIVAAPLHDIGKVHIPDAILNKPGRLTEEEFDVMKTHALEGCNIIERAKSQMNNDEYLDVAKEMAAYHHEWWNGKGYPYGKMGEDIPLCARIMAVADVFDALTAKRCYKEAMPLEKAYAIIREEAGTHFDPSVVEAFFDAIDEIEAAYKEELNIRSQDKRKALT